MASVLFLHHGELHGPDNDSVVLGDPKGETTTKGRKHLLPVARRGLKRQRREEADRRAAMNGIDEQRAQAREQVLVDRLDLTHFDQVESPDGSRLRGMVPHRRTARLQRYGFLRAPIFSFLPVWPECIQVRIEGV